MHKVVGKSEVQQRHDPLIAAGDVQCYAASGDVSFVKPEWSGAGCDSNLDAPRLRPLGRLLYHEVDHLPLLERRERHVDHF